MGGVDWINVAQDGQVAGTGECSNEPLGSIKCFVSVFYSFLQVCLVIFIFIKYNS